MKRLWIVLLMLPLVARAQNDTVYVRQWDVVRGLDGVAFTLGAPSRWKGKDWLTAGAVVAGTAAVTLLDEPARELLGGHRSHTMDRIERIPNHYGKPYSAVGITAGLYLTGVIAKNEWARETGLMLATALTTSTAMQTFFKNAIGRARPNEDLGNYEVKPFNPETKFHSLPSGHTTVAFTVSLVLAKRVESIPLKIVFCTLAAGTAVSRLYLDVHWLSDIAFGGAIAWFCADAAVKRLEQNLFRSVVRKQKLSVKLYPFPGGLSLRAHL